MQLITNNNKKWWLTFALGLMSVMINIDATVVNLALATIGRELHASLSNLQWVSSGYFMSTAIFFIPGGKLADLFGRKKLYLTGTIIFGVASLLCGASFNQYLLIAARILQGIGFGLAYPSVVVMLSNAFPPHRRGFIIGMILAISGVSQSIGPPVGGLILKYLSWHWIFLINVPLSILSIVVLLSIQLDKQSLKQTPFDYSGTLLLTAGLTPIIMALNQANQWGFASAAFIGCVIVGMLFLIAFYFKQQKTKYPLLEFSLFRNRNFSLISAARSLYLYIFCGYVFVIPLYLQNIIGYTPVKTSFIMLSNSVTFGLLSIYAGRIIDRIGFKKPLLIAATISIISTFILTWLHQQFSLTLFLISLPLLGISISIFFSGSMTAGISSLPADKSSLGIGVILTLTFIGGAAGTTITGTLLALLSNHYLLSRLTQQAFVISASQLERLTHIANGAHPLSQLNTLLNSAQVNVLTPLIQHTYTLAFSNIFWLLTALGVICFILCCYLRSDEGL